MEYSFISLHVASFSKKIIFRGNRTLNDHHSLNLFEYIRVCRYSFLSSPEYENIIKRVQ